MINLPSQCCLMYCHHCLHPQKCLFLTTGNSTPYSTVGRDGITWWKCSRCREHIATKWTGVSVNHHQYEFTQLEQVTQYMCIHTSQLIRSITCISSYMFRLIHRATLCNSQSTNNCTYKPLQRVAWRWLCIQAETRSQKYN